MTTRRCEKCGGTMYWVENKMAKYGDQALAVACLAGGALGTLFLPGPGRASVVMGAYAAKERLAKAKTHWNWQCCDCGEICG